MTVQECVIACNMVRFRWNFTGLRDRIDVVCCNGGAGGAADVGTAAAGV